MTILWWVSVALAAPLSTVHADFELPGTQPGGVQGELNFAPAQDCNVCHGYEAQNPDEATAVLYERWAGGMMAHSARDPIFWAALAVANQDAPEAGSLCLRCHAPRGWLLGRDEPDGSELSTGDTFGTQCIVCHRMVDPANQEPEGSEVHSRNLEVLTALAESPHGVPGSYGNGMMVIDPEDQRRGPRELRDDWYVEDCQGAFCGNGNPHRPLDWPLESDFHRSSELCGSCHNVSNPLLQWDESDGAYVLNAMGEALGDGVAYPVERTFDEWRLSAYNSEAGVSAPEFDTDGDGVVRSCQDCHMPRMNGVAAFDNGAVPCSVDGEPCMTFFEREDMADHLIVGGNSWAPRLIDYLDDSLEPDQVEISVMAAESMLQRAATLEAEIDGDRLLHVTITNQTGHKLPTGYGEGRQMWVSVVARDADGQVVYQSGEYDELGGQLLHDPDLAWFGIEAGIGADVAAASGQTEGHSYHFVLNSETLFDNRIPPRGFDNAAFAAAGAAPIGASYTDGQHWAEVSFQLPESAVEAEIALRYQTSSREYIEFLREANTTNDAGELLFDAWEETGMSPPVTLASVGAFAPADTDVPPDTDPQETDVPPDTDETAETADTNVASETPPAEEGCHCASTSPGWSMGLLALPWWFRRRRPTSQLT